jgi:protein O-GlcNAc transferase
MSASKVEELRRLADEYQRGGRWAEAESAYRQLLAIDPGNEGAGQMLAFIEHRSGRSDQAEARLRGLIASQPGNAGHYNALGSILADGRTDEAVDVFRIASSLEPQNPQILHNLGTTLMRGGRPGEAVEAFQRALQLRDDLPPVYGGLGNALRALGRTAEAVSAYRRAVSMGYRPASIYYNLGSALYELDDLENAAASFREAIATCVKVCQLRPADPSSHRMLADALFRDGREEEALDVLKRAPSSPFIASDLLFSLHRRPDYDRRRLFEAHDEWDRQFARHLGERTPRHENDRSPERRLRVGYVAYELGNHPHGRLLLPVFEHHDRTSVEVYCYCEARSRDWVGDRLAELSKWCETRGLSDEALAERIRQDRIDILVDIQMHVARHRLLTFARRPAPVQVTYLAYSGTTGLRAMDYRLTDRFMDPPGQDDSVYAERSIRLPHSFWCYPAPPGTPPLTAPPLGRNGYVTFGSLNAFLKFTPAVWSAWAELLRRVPDSRLVVSCPKGEASRRLLQMAAKQGVDVTRLQLLEPCSLSGYFGQYELIDVGLDPFPYPGGVTTMDALWMGVPVVTLAGETAISRGGLSILSNIGLGEMAAGSTEEYIHIAAELAGNKHRIVDLRLGLRGRMKASPLMDASGFTRDLEGEFRTMWRRYCSG